MFVAIVKCDVMIHESGSLKMRRSVMKRLSARFFSKFRVRLYEVGELDRWNYGECAFAIIANDHRYLEHKTDKMIEFLRGYVHADVDILSRDIMKS